LGNNERPGVNFPQPAYRCATSKAHTSFHAEAEYAKLK
jgi:hypothetical protein